VLDSADNAYYAVLEAMATLEAEESSLQTALTSLSIAQVRQASGMINQGDYLKAMADKEARENSRNQAKRNLSLTITKLKAITGLNDLPELQQIDFSGYEELISYLGNISDNEADLLYNKLWKTIVSSNPSLAKSVFANQRAENNLTMAQRAYLPSLSASLSAGLNYSLKNGMELSGGRLSINLSIPVDYWVLANNVEKSKNTRDSRALDYIGAEISLEASSMLINSRNNLIKARYGFLQSLSKLRSLGAFSDEERLIEILKGSS